MLNNLSEQIRECYRHAEDCAQKAAVETDPGLREDFLRLEKRWLDGAEHGVCGTAKQLYKK
jgi:hypothetical protein